MYIPPLITLDTYITSRSAEGQYSLRRYVSKTSRAIAIARLKPSITRQGLYRAVSCEREDKVPLNRDRPLNYFFEVKRNQHIVSSTYRLSRHRHFFVRLFRSWMIKTHYDRYSLSLFHFSLVKRLISCINGINFYEIKY